MEFTAHRRRVTKTIVSDALPDVYNHNLSMYKEPPSSTIPLTEFEDLAVEKVQLFRILEQADLKGHILYSADWINCVKEDIRKAGLKKYLRLIDGSSTNTELDYQARRADLMSHYILRIAYCRSEDLRRWFLSRELEWFRLRFSALSPENIKNFLQTNNFTYIPISEEEKLQLREELEMSTPAVINTENTDFYKVPFMEVYPLVKSRKVFVKSRFAYIPASELVICIQTKFRAYLNEELNVYYRRLPMFDDERIAPLLASLHHVHTGNNYYTPSLEDKDSVDPANLDGYSKKHFPLCMKHMHDILRANHHLKHHCRLTYGLFLKGIGLLYEDAMRFWKEEFTKKIDANKFDKEYAYNIKHLYGKVGKMQNYSPYSCIKIIKTSVGPGEHHGCPFKQWDPAIVRQKMIENGLSTEGADEVKNLVTAGHYQLACTKHFECAHGQAPTNSINHPNQYFEESMKLMKKNIENNKK